jgi:RIO kinase 2
MISMDHQNAEMYFDRDVECIKRFFARRFHFESTTPGPFFKDAKKTVGRDGARRLDAAVEASGFTKKMAKDLEAAIREQQANASKEGSAGDEEDDEEDDDSEEEEEDDDDDDESGSVGGDGGHQVIGDHVLEADEGLQKLIINDGT